MRMFFRPAVVVASLGTMLVTAGTARQQPHPQFRAGVTLTRVEVTVLDKRTRKPITGLTADDFIVKVSGDLQRVANVAEVTFETRGTEPRAAGFVEGAHECDHPQLPTTFASS